MKTLKASAKLGAANAMLHPELRETIEDYTAEERRMLAKVYKDWAQQLSASADFMAGKQPAKCADKRLAKLSQKAGVEIKLCCKFRDFTAEQDAAMGRVLERWAKLYASRALLNSGPSTNARN